jgi:3-deoxy-manno-octulosonate cytidylyltransferase (CMP-KDO synthetase)
VHPNSVERLPFTLTESSVLAVIPARYHSTRLPAKILADIAGRPMIEHVYRRAAAARLVHGVIVATDDDRIAAAVRGFGGAAIMTRADHVSGTDRIAEVVSAMPCRAVINLQGDEPLIEPETIDAAVKPLLEDSTLEMTTICRPLASLDEFRNPNVVKVVTNYRGDALYFSRAPIPASAPSAALGASAASAALGASAPSAALGASAPSAALPAPARAHVGLYVYRRETLLKLAALPAAPLETVESLEQLRALAHGIRIRVVETKHAAAGVDTADDLERVRWAFARQPRQASYGPSAVAVPELSRSEGGRRT